MPGPYLIEKYKKVFISWVTFSDFLRLPSLSCRGWHPESKCHSYKMPHIWVFILQVKAIQCKPEMLLLWELPCMHTQTHGLPSRAEGRSEVPWGSRPGTDVLVSASVSHWHQIPSLPPKVKGLLAASVLLYSPGYRSLDHVSLWLLFCPSSYAFPSFSDIPKSWCPAFLCCELPRAGDRD